MANYTLSIDEEVYAAGMASYRGALEQGRCGMALLIKWHCGSSCSCSFFSNNRSLCGVIIDRT
ncbi:MAG: hypothetical protein K9M81_01290 [Chthoniobacterales bacterium]|nr:hypothetical protein [Chthoniobacterales bacterium]